MEDILSANMLILDKQINNEGIINVNGKVVIVKNVIISDNSVVRSHCIIGDSTTIEDKAFIGPYTSI